MTKNRVQAPEFEITRQFCDSNNTLPNAAKQVPGNAFGFGILGVATKRSCMGMNRVSDRAHINSKKN